jgi:IPT/TIG domain
MSATIRRTTVAVLTVLLTFGTTTVARAAAPVITSFTPTNGPPGTSVVLTGSGFTGATSVKFNVTPTTFNVNASGTQITTTVPAGATTGRISVTVSGVAGSSSTDFIVTGAAPTISGFNPTGGPPGTSVVITGSGFIGTTSVKFNTQVATFIVNSDGQITTTVPAGATDGKISVVTASNGTATSSGSFDVTSGSAPTISTFSPMSGPPGTLVIISGSNFVGVSSVRFNGVSATFNVVNPSQITTTVPTSATDGKISVVTTSNGTATSSGSFDVTSGAAPTISSFSPTRGQIGTSVTINGANFTGATSVRFNGVVAGFTVQNSGRITTAVPSGASTGKISVTTPTGTATSSGTFTVTAPLITSFNPKSGPAGTSVTIHGFNFTGTTSVTFNGVVASFTVQDTSRIIARVPSGATTGRITVTSPSGTSTSSDTFTVTGGFHDRSVSLHLSSRLFASGRVTVNDGYQACLSQVPVAIKRYRHGEWHWMANTSTLTDGTYSTYLPDRIGTYRAKAKKIKFANGDICGGGVSNTVMNRH